MHQIDAPGNVAGLFTEGDPGLSQPPTVVSDDWLNAVQMEIVNVIFAAGLTLSKPDNTQLRQAIRALSTPTLLGSYVTYIKSAMTFDNAWHTLTVAGVPGTAKWMYVGGWVENLGSPNNARQSLWVRPQSGGQQMILSHTNGVAGDYENDCAFGPVLVPCNGGNLDYKWSDDVTDANFIVYGYM